MMKAVEKRLLEILDPTGLALLIRKSLSRAEMIRIANTSRVFVPGMRNRSVSLEHLSEALADKFVAEGPSRRAILKALQAASRSTLPSYRRMSPEDIRSRLGDGERVRADTDMGKLLFLLIAEPRDDMGEEEVRAAVMEAARATVAKEPEPAAAAVQDGELQALRHEKVELSRRAADLVALVDRLRERDRRFREELAQRKFDVNNLKLQLAKSRKERDSLEKEMRALNHRLEQVEKKPLPLSDLSERMAAVLAELRRVGTVVEKLPGRMSREDGKTSASPMAQIGRGLEELVRETRDLRKALAIDRERLVKLVEDIPVQLEEALQGSLADADAGREAERRAGLERVGVFVDVQNMFYAARGQNARLDFEVLLQTATRGRRLIRALAYVVEAKEIDQSGFIALLQQKKYEVKRKDLKVRSDGSFKGDWDMEIALDALEMADALDVVVLVTGDGDFTGLVQKLKIRGPRVEVYSFPQNTAKELREAADKFVPIDKRMLIRMSRVVPRPAPAGTAGA